MRKSKKFSRHFWNFTKFMVGKLRKKKYLFGEDRLGKFYKLKKKSVNFVEILKIF